MSDGHVPEPAPPPPSLRGLDVEVHLRNPALKQRFVTPLFDIVAPRYDRFTRVFSFGMDRRWKELLLDEVAAFAPPGAVALDLACGTGDIAFAVAERVPGVRVTGVDTSPRMVALATRRAAAAPNVNARAVDFRVGDMARLDRRDVSVPDASVDVVTAGYGLRNAPDHRAALAEIARVLRPGGRLHTLDFYRPERALWRRLFLGYLSVAGSAVGWLWHGEPVVYGYIARSIDHFVSWRAFGAALEEAGFAVERVHRKLLGGIALHRARRR
jgi:demethylmenaquinone methyltransferase / 2-methoxy-6-polyprenyl-1,4-benzoquinol methylase